MDSFTEGKEVTQEEDAVRSGDTRTQPGQQADQTHRSQSTHKPTRPEHLCPGRVEDVVEPKTGCHRHPSAVADCAETIQDVLEVVAVSALMDVDRKNP